LRVEKNYGGSSRGKRQRSMVVIGAHKMATAILMKGNLEVLVYSAYT
jgi:hypothetical protein